MPVLLVLLQGLADGDGTPSYRCFSVVRRGSVPAQSVTLTLRKHSWRSYD